MKRVCMLAVIVLVLVGCKQPDSEIDRGMAVREEFLQSNGCEFEAVVTADYGDDIYTFQLICSSDRNGAMSFTVSKPATIAGISGRIAQDKGELTFDDKALAFELLADGQISPVCAPWLMVRSLRSGYLSACGRAGEELKLELDDSYAEDALHLDIWIDEKDKVKRCEILWQGRRYLTIEVNNFVYL